MIVRRLLICTILLSPFSRSRAESSALPSFQKGVTISCQTWGREWQTPEMAQTLDELKTLGVNSVAIHPYARIQNDGAITYRTIDDHRHIRVPLDWAHERGLSVMLIPHIAYWGSKFSWRGDINFEKPEEWDRFFADYEKWIVEMATVAEAHRAPLFCVGLEFSHAQKQTERWWKIIKAVRQVYRGKITYGANWNDYQDVKFWDAVDYVGVLAYFPLTKSANPGSEELARAWEKRSSELQKFSDRQGGKQFVFVEIGYNNSAQAAAEPWSFKTGGEHADEIQARCIETALQLTGKSYLAGMYWWKWFPEIPDDEEENYRIQTPEIKALLSKYWGVDGK